MLQWLDQHKPIGRFSTRIHSCREPNLLVKFFFMNFFSGCPAPPYRQTPIGVNMQAAAAAGGSGMNIGMGPQQFQQQQRLRQQQLLMQQGMLLIIESIG